METPTDTADQMEDRFAAVYPGDLARFRLVEHRQQQVEDLLLRTGYQALLLTDPENFVWFTAGGDWRLVAPGDSLGAALFLSLQHRVVLCAATWTLRLFREQIPALGFELKERPTPLELTELLDEVCRGRSVMSDTGFGRTRAFPELLAPLKSRSECPSIDQ